MRPALGTFKHEAVAVDQRRRRLYLTEDEGDGRFYRFTPERWPALDAGTLEVAAVSSDGDVRWIAVPDPNPEAGSGTPTRLQVPESTAFAGGEGITHRRGHVYFTTKGDNRVWDYEPDLERLRVFYDAATHRTPRLSGVDNVTTSRRGDLVVAEDGGNMEIVVLTPDRHVSPLLRVLNQDGSELCGPAFDPSGRRLYFSSQRGGGAGITYEITGPFRQGRRPLLSSSSALG
jgi:secreted PhoX family phosphatase